MLESASENVPVSGGEPIVVSGQSPSFDDFEAVGTPKPNGDKFAEQEAVEKKEAKEDNTSKQQLAKVKEADEATKDTEGDADAKPIKYIKAKHGDGELELATDTVVPTKVAGKLENPTLAELQADFSGRVNWDRKYSELSRERTSFDTQVKSLNGMIEQMLEASKEDPYKFFDVIAEATGQDPIAMKMETINQQVALAKQISHMSETELESWKKGLMTKFREDNLASRESRIKQADTDREEVAKVTELRTRYNIDEEAYSEAERVAKEYIPDRQPTNEEVVTVDRHLMAIKAIETVNATLADRGDYHEIVNYVRDEAIKNPGYTGQDLAEIITAAFGGERAQRLAKKIKDSESLPSGMVKTAQNERKVLYSFDDL